MAGLVRYIDGNERDIYMSWLHVRNDNVCVYDKVKRGYL